MAITRMTASVPQQQRAGAPASVVTAAVQEMRAEHVAPMTLYLATDDAWNINGQIFHVSGGMVSLAQPETPIATITKSGKWTLEELATLVPQYLMHGIPNPAPPPDELDLPGRPVKAEA